MHILHTIYNLNEVYVQKLHIFLFFCIFFSITLYSFLNKKKQMNKTTSMLKNQQYSTCIESDNECMMACELVNLTECMTMMSSSSGNNQQQMMNMNMARCMMMCRDCADMCRMASMMMCRGSEYVKQMCEMCADMCEACATECEKMGI